MKNVTIQIDEQDLNIRYEDGSSIWYKIKEKEAFDKLNDVLFSFGFEVGRIDPPEEK
jgi:hypothetical protein